MELINQPFTGQLGTRLLELLESGQFQTINIAVAFAKNSGVLRVKDSFERFRSQGGTINVYVGVDLEGTSYEALTALLVCTDRLSVVHSEKAQTFHPKIYQFIGQTKRLVVVGSHNLTGGGLWTNFESSILISSGHEDNEFASLEAGLTDYLAKLDLLDKSLMTIGAQADVDRLLAEGYILKEVSQQVRRAKAEGQSEARKRLFGYGVTAKLPPISVSVPQSTEGEPPSVSSISVPQGDQGPTIWLETRRLTGGSRNILDLSMRSLVSRGDATGSSYDVGDPRFMRGGVEFFGINPADVHRTKDIVLNFEGIDYSGNTILFPVGTNPNGTWRLQIKGVDSSGKKITSAFRDKGEEHYLVGKIVTFTKIQDDYYFLSVFPGGELESFKAASTILARNGLTNNAKRIGLL